MRAEFLHEPPLDFGAGSHVDVRFGIQRYGVLDFDDPSRRAIRVGIVGSGETVEELLRWIARISKGVTAKESNQPNLFPAFPGIGPDHGFHVQMEADHGFSNLISKRDLEKLLEQQDSNQIAMDAAKLFDERVRQLQEDKQVHVVLCALPLNLAEQTINASNDDGVHNFHHHLKALALKHQAPTQVVLPHTYDPAKKLKRKTRFSERTIQDEATRAWNFATALYYKAGGIPWRMQRLSTGRQTCFIGIAFYKLLDSSALQASVAQVFDERGEGVIVRGAMASTFKDDRHPYLESKDAYTLLRDALARYRLTHGHAPARIVVHKSSTSRPEEVEGFERAVLEERIDARDYLAVGQTSIRLFRKGEYPPLRGTLLELDSAEGVLYTTGSVDFYRTYPGQYIPSPVLIRGSHLDESLSQNAKDILALSKMNWNKTQLDGRLPITLEASRQVGGILKYVDSGFDVQNPYRFFM
jgi:hypothetical protein